MAELISLLTLIQQYMMSYGPMGLGWLISAALAWFIYKTKGDRIKEKDKTQEKLLKTKDEYVTKVQEMNDKLNVLNAKHAEIISHISERRIDDLKELTDDYNQLATNTLITLDKFVVALEVSNSRKIKKLGV